jgi:UDP-glucuronate 4-epimerase
MRILVTGGAGFIGSHVCAALRARGDEVALLDDFNDFYDPALKRAVAAAAGARIFEVDVRDAGALREVFAQFSPAAVIHLAARAGVRASLEDPALYVEVNVQGTLALLAAMRAAGCRRLVFASSSSVYGEAGRAPFGEDQPLDSIVSPYAVTKLAAEQLCRIAATQDGLAVTALRFFTVYGPRQRPDLAISKFTARIAEGRPIELYGDGSSSRDYTYVDDIAAGVLAALDRLAPGFRVYNLGGDQPVSLARLVSELEAVIGRRAEIVHRPPQPGDVSRTWADISRARAELGYEPRVRLAEGLARYVAWWREHQPATLSAGACA